MFSRIIILLIVCSLTTRGQQALFSTKGIQPAICVGENESIEMVFGKGNAFYYATSKDKGRFFTLPVLVDSLLGLHLGVSRGPQIASSHLSTVITAVDKAGNV